MAACPMRRISSALSSRSAGSVGMVGGSPTWNARIVHSVGRWCTSFSRVPTGSRGTAGLSAASVAQVGPAFERAPGIHDRGNVRRHGVCVEAADRRRPRSRGNACDGARGGRRARRRIADARGNAGPGRTRPTTTTADVAPVSGDTAHASSRPPDRAGRGGRHPRLRGDGPAPGLRRGHGHHAPRPRRRDPRRRPPHPHHLAGPAPGAGGPRPAVPFPGLRQPPRRCSPHRALGPRRPDRARQPRAAVPPAPPGGARRGVPGHDRRRR